MATYLVSIVSEQTIPNVQFIKEFPSFNKYIFVTTEKIERERQAKWIKTVCKLPAESCINVKVEADSLPDIFMNLQGLNLPTDSEITINLTGGTKIMALGVFQYFTRRFPESKVVYIPIGSNGYKLLHPIAYTDFNPLSVRLNLTDYLACYGIELTSDSKDDALEQSLKVTRWFYQKYPFGKSPIPALRNYKNDQYKRGNRNCTIDLSKPPYELRDLWAWLGQTGFQSRLPGWLNDNEIQWLIGGWFEEYVYMLFRVHLALPEEAIGTSMMIKRREVLNECDVLFTHNNTLHLIECKTYLNKERFENTVYKIGAIRKDFGLYVKSYLFTASRSFAKGKGGRILPHIENRLKLMNIELVDNRILRREDTTAEFFKRFG